jgi:integrase/recombinase XerD
VALKRSHGVFPAFFKTPSTVLTGEQARELLDSIDTSTVVGLRDRALISVMTFGFARIGAAVAIRG